jgi:8-oxo-dGTP pyrophosphatase MutT (NUDIX family)
VINQSDETFLLVRLSYSHKNWTIPGGGIKRNEPPQKAAERELKEETGLEVKLLYFGSYDQTIEYKNDTVDCYVGTIENPEVTIDTMEIVDYCWVDSHALPDGTRPSVTKILELYDSKKEIHHISTATKRSLTPSEDTLLVQKSAERVANSSTKRLTHNEVWNL